MSGESPDLFNGVFRWQRGGDGRGRLTRHESPPLAIPDPLTGQNLRIATVELGSRATCPSCAAVAEGGFISFIADLRLAYACPDCCQFVWLNGA